MRRKVLITMELCRPRATAEKVVEILPHYD